MINIYLLDFSETWHYIAEIAFVLSLLYQFVKIYPYTYLAKKQVFKFKGGEPNATISILVSNVLTPNTQYEKLIGLVNEVNQTFYLHWKAIKNGKKELSVLEKEYPNTVKIPQDNLYGMHLYSRLELEDIKVQYIVQEDIPSIHAMYCSEMGKR